jgi:outer membrane receptor for ferrienterochelin and colicin
MRLFVAVDENRLLDMKTVDVILRTPALLAIGIMASSGPMSAFAQQEDEEPDPVVEEIVAVGRFVSASQSLANERLDDATVVDVLGADSISRLGDSTVADALRRMPGLSLVGGKFVYVRGLGERYSATSLNGSQVPSPDLTRNVIPLDIFPTSVIESLRVQKTWSPNLPANFAGGNVDMRTRGIPDSFEFNIELGSGFNSETSGNVLSYPGGGDDSYGSDDGTRALSPEILGAADQFLGSLSTQGILAALRREDSNATLEAAQAINRDLALALNRDIGIEEKSSSPDVGLKASVGSRYALNDNWDFGFMVGATYDTEWRESIRRATNHRFPERRIDTVVESTRSVNLAGTLNFGLGFTEDHEVTTTTLFLRNTDDETAVQDFFNENREVPDGLGWRNYRLKFEERNMRTNQIRGTHYLGDATRDIMPRLFDRDWIPVETQITWFYSDSDAETDIPNELHVAAQTVTDPLTGQVLSSGVAPRSNSADYRFTDLDDEVEDYGWAFTWPIETNRSTIELSGGAGHSQKARTYRQAQFTLGALRVGDGSILAGPLDEVFSDENILNPANNFVFARTGTNNQSYIAATMTDHFFGNVDWTYNDTWRVAAGARWEDYRQVAVGWNPFGYTPSNPQVTTNPNVLQRGTFADDKAYPAVQLTYMTDWWAETFQLRLGWSETAIRPDLREITDASYIDPLTDDLVKGNSGVVPSDVSNYDIRAEWFFSSGDNFTITLFSKDIELPIEFFESPASDTTIAREILNADSAKVHGIEFEFLKELAFIGGPFDMFFLQGNLTVQDSELVVGPRASAPTNPVRKMTGASDYVANLMVGYDSRNARHTASLIYNIFDERLYVAGRNGAPDGFEQPFTSVDVTYSWYPTDAITVKAKAQNILGDKITIERGGVQTFEEEPGTSFAVGVQWSF